MTAPESHAGLCATCTHCRRVATDRSLFFLCTLSLTDDRFRKYPTLPVIRCAGYGAEPPSGAPEPAKVPADR